MIKNFSFINEFINTCHQGCKLGWHERNGGNLSYRLTTEDVEIIKKQFDFDKEWIPLSIQVPNLANEFFLVTASGMYFSSIDDNIEENIGIVNLNNTGDKYRIVWGFANNNKPTSEFPSHILNHSVKKAKSNGIHRVIYHAHTTNIIALTFVLPLSSKVFTKKLWSMATECPVVFPEGLGVLPWMIPGGSEIAKATSELMKEYNAVIWAHHGIFCSGSSFEKTFGLMHTIEKAAEVLVKVMSMTNETINTISNEELLSLEKSFSIKLNRKLLKCK